MGVVPGRQSPVSGYKDSHRPWCAAQWQQWCMQPPRKPVTQATTVHWSVQRTLSTIQRAPRDCEDHRRPPRYHSTQAFVGTRGENASEYHDNDFPWETLCQDGRDAIRRQVEERARERRVQNGDQSRTPSGHEQGEARGHAECDWEDFHAQHSLGRFFKEKRYLPIEFPQLRDPNITIGEIGCGCGSALIPVLRDNPTATAVACDVSATAISVFQDSAMPGAGIDAGRVRLSVDDFPNTTPFDDQSLDVVMIIFTLSAFHPRDMKRVVRTVQRALRPGGLVVVRDYGLYDMAQLRFHGSQLVDPDHLVYRRLDGTLSHFFDINDLVGLFVDAGYQQEEAKYCTVSLRNKKKDLAMRRVFVHGVFRAGHP